MKHVEIVQAAFVRPFVVATRRAGTPIDRYLHSSHLNQYHLEDGGSFVPTPAFFHLLHLIARNESGPEVPAEFTSNYCLSESGAFGVGLLGCEDILTACKAATSPNAQQFSQERLSLRIDGTRSRLVDAFTWGADIPQLWIEQFSLHLIIDGLRAGGGQDWLPTEVHLTADAPSSYVEELAGKGVVIRLGQPALAVVFPTSLLAAPMCSDLAEPRIAGPAPKLPHAASSRIEQLLDSASDIRPLAHTDFARQMELSPRTLQRILEREGTTFSEVVNQWRLKASLRMLVSENLLVSEISQQLRYSHSANFIRAFKSWTGTSPQAYRDQLASHHQRQRDLPRSAPRDVR